MGNLAMRTMPGTTKSNPKFISSEGAASMRGGLEIGAKPEVVSRTRPGTEAGRMRARRQTEPVASSPDVQIDQQPHIDDYTQSTNMNSSTAKKSKTHTIRVQGSSRMHTPRFSI